MNTTSKLSIVSFALVGLFATGCSQQQVKGGGSGGSQVAGSSQQVAGTGQQQVQNAPEAPAPAPEPIAAVSNPNSHTHPSVPGCTNSITHTHPSGATSHNHKYGCKGQTGNRHTHSHPAVPQCTKSIKHTHKYNNRNHTHKYSCKGGAGASNNVNVHALQRKLKAKGFYRGPINGVVTPETRSALQRYMQNR